MPFRFREHPREKQFVLLIVSIGIFVGIFASTVPFEEARRTLQEADKTLFWLAFLINIPIFFLTAVRWFFVIRAFDLTAPFRRLLAIVFGSISLTLFPGRLGDFGRSYPLRDVIPLNQSLGTIFIERIIDICVLLLYVSGGLFFLRTFLPSFLALLAAVCVLPLIWLLSRFLHGQKRFTNAFTKKIEEVLGCLNQMKGRKRFLFAAILCSVLSWALTIFQYLLLLHAVHATPPLAAVFGLFPLTVFVSLIPITLAGAGTREAALIQFFRPYALPSQSLAAGILYTLQGYWLPALFCLPLFIFFFRTTKTSTTTPQETEEK